MLKKLWIDVETTGLDHETDQIIELAAYYDQDTVFHQYYLPDKYPDNFEEITKITGITWDFLIKNGLPHEDENAFYHLFEKFLDCIIDKYDKQDKLVFAGYNSGFDNLFVRELFKRNDNKFFGSYFVSTNFDLITLVADELCKGKLQMLENYKLQTVCEFYGISFQAHSAIEDIKATIQLYDKINNKEQRTWTKGAEKPTSDIVKTLIR